VGIGPPGDRLFVFRHLPPAPWAVLAVCSPVGGEADTNYRRVSCSHGHWPALVVDRQIPTRSPREPPYPLGSFAGAFA
jgi:hypothetical protein